MTIDEAIKHGQVQLKVFGGEHKEFIETSIATIRKYQKINQILDNWNAFKYDDNEVLRLISEVIYED